MTTQRWNDEMLDSLAERVSEISSEEFRQYQEEFRQHQLEYEQYKRENDQRFNNLLEEVRFLIRKLGQDQDEG